MILINMKHGIVRVSMTFWNDRYLRNGLLKYIRVIKKEPDMAILGYIVLCRSEYFYKEVKEGCRIPEYDIEFTTTPRKSIFGIKRKDKIILMSCTCND